MVAQNAVNAIFCAVAFPLGVCVLLSQISRSDKQLLLCGSVTCGASYAFPLRALVIHQNYPNVVAFCLVPLMVCLLVSAVHSKTEDGSFKLELNRAALALFIVSLIGLVDLHPNAAIACGVIGGCYVIGGLVPAWGRSLPQKPSSFLQIPRLRGWCDCPLLGRLGRLPALSRLCRYGRLSLGVDDPCVRGAQTGSSFGIEDRGSSTGARSGGACRLHLVRYP